MRQRSARTPLYCNNCGEQCGWIVGDVWGDHGADPPEYEPYRDDCIDESGFCYCCPECMEAENPPEGEEPDE